MLPMLEDILRMLQDRELLPATAFVGIDYDAVLDWRDTDPFDAEWVRASGALEGMRAAAEPGPDFGRLFDDVRREAFMITTRATGHHEIASYISEDFELIALDSAFAAADPFVAKLWAAYSRGELPSSENFVWG